MGGHCCASAPIIHRCATRYRQDAFSDQIDADCEGAQTSHGRNGEKFRVPSSKRLILVTVPLSLCPATTRIYCPPGTGALQFAMGLELRTSKGVDGTVLGVTKTFCKRRSSRIRLHCFQSRRSWERSAAIEQYVTLAPSRARGEWVPF